MEICCEGPDNIRAMEKMLDNNTLMKGYMCVVWGTFSRYENVQEERGLTACSMCRSG
jgi:hypothetical protein